MATVLITGGTGLIGSAITKELISKGYEVIILTRKSPDTKDPKQSRISYAHWDVEQQAIDKEAIEKADHIIHLAGANVAGGRWTEKRKREIVDSRVKSGALLVKALSEIPNKIQTVISASAIGWYGPDPQIPNSKKFIESDNAATDFLGETCKQWEAAIQPVTELNKRLVILRTGIVLSNEGGAYAEFKKPLKFGVASVLGTGKQIMSWIHIDDLVRIYIYAIENKNLQGVYNAVAIKPVSNEGLIKKMAKTNGRPYIVVPVPSVVLKIVLGEMSIEVLKSTTVSSSKIEEAGYQFLFSDIETAVFNLNKKAS
jgi:uncharacterized protein (TIGR01777 family)